MNVFTFAGSDQAVSGATLQVKLRERDGLSYVHRPPSVAYPDAQGIPVSNRLLVSPGIMTRSESAPGYGGHFETKHLITLVTADYAPDFDFSNMPDMLVPGKQSFPTDPILCWFPGDRVFRLMHSDILPVGPSVDGALVLMPGLVLLEPNVWLMAETVVSSDPEQLRPRGPRSMWIQWHEGRLYTQAVAPAAERPE